MQYAPTKRRTFRVMATVVFAAMFGILGELTFAPTSAPAGAAYAGQAANVDFVHRYITKKWGITVPIKTSNIYQVVNIKYTLCAVDRANEILNGTPPATTYCNHPLATNQIIDTIKVVDAVDRLVKLNVPGPGEEGEPFKLTLTGIAANDQFSFWILASGNFTVDWGDGTAIQTITRTDATISTTYAHTYSAAGNYVVTIGGKATGYYNVNIGSAPAAIGFGNATNKTKITAISGDLGSVFPILSTPLAFQFHTPVFNSTFLGLTGLTGSIPPNLFAGLHGAPVLGMFNSTFANCTGLTGPIPSNLFAGISGAPARNLFFGTFYGCKNLSGPIPANLFAGISGPPIVSMFENTFVNCTSLTSIPSGLFARISGATDSRIFANTFWGCTGLTGSIPAGLFGKLTGEAFGMMFEGTFGSCTGLTGIADGIWDLSGVTNTVDSDFLYQTFYNCSNITSASPSVKAGSATKLWTQFSNHVTGSQTFTGATKMADYSSIPAGWK